MRILRTAATVIAMFILLTLSVIAADVYIDGEKVMYNEATGYPYTENGVVLVPLYPTFEAFGKDVIIQDNPNGTVVITKGNISVSCNTSDNMFIRCGSKIKAPCGLVWKGGPLYVPTEIFTAFDAEVYVNGSGVIITRKKEPSEIEIYGASANGAERGSTYFSEKYEPINGIYAGSISAKDVSCEGSEFFDAYGTEEAIFTVTADISQMPNTLGPELRYAAESGKIMRLVLEGIDFSAPDSEKLSQTAEYLEGSGARILLCPTNSLTCINSEKHFADAEQFKKSYVEISDIFRAKAPSVAMVWQICSCGIRDAAAYYPGDMYIHYAEASICEDCTDIYDSLSLFNATYGYKKPMMLAIEASSPLFSVAPEKCSEFFTVLPMKYPGIKAVLVPSAQCLAEKEHGYVNMLRSGFSGISYIGDPNKVPDAVPYYFTVGNGVEVVASKLKIYLANTDFEEENIYVIYKLNGSRITEAPLKHPPYETEIDLTSYTGKTVSIGAVIYDSTNVPLGEAEYMINVGEEVTQTADSSQADKSPIPIIVAIVVGVACVLLILKKINDIFC